MLQDASARVGHVIRMGPVRVTRVLKKRVVITHTHTGDTREIHSSYYSTLFLCLAPRRSTRVLIIQITLHSTSSFPPANGYGSTYPSPLRFGAWGTRKLQGQGVVHPLKGLSARKPRPPLP